MSGRTVEAPGLLSKGKEFVKANPVVLFGGMIVLMTTTFVASELSGGKSVSDVRRDAPDAISRFDFDYAGGYGGGDGWGPITTGQLCLAATEFDPDFISGRFSESPEPSEGSYDAVSDVLTIQPSTGARALKLSGMKTFTTPLQPVDQYTRDILDFYGCSLK